MRLLYLLAAGLTAAAAGPAAAGTASGPTALPSTVIVTAQVGDSAVDTMPPTVWRKLVIEYLGGRSTLTDDEPTIADDARCRAAHAGYAVFATFDRAPRLPGLAQDPDRVYAVARFTVRNCITGTLLPARVIALESEPAGARERSDAQPNPARVWEPAMRSALAIAPLIAPSAHVIRVRGGIVTIERAPGFSLNQVLRATPGGAGAPRAAYELVVTDVAGKIVQATILGKGDARPGDLVEPAPAP